MHKLCSLGKKNSLSYTNKVRANKVRANKVRTNKVRAKNNCDKIRSNIYYTLPLFVPFPISSAIPDLCFVTPQRLHFKKNLS